MLDCKNPAIRDIGPCETILVETVSGKAVYGSSGISHAMAAARSRSGFRGR